MFRIKTDFEQKLFILAILFIPFNHFIVEFPIVGGDISKLFALVGVCTYLGKICIKKAVLDSFERFAFFYLAVYFLWQCLCTTIGILEYEYYDMIYLEQMDKLRYLLRNLRHTGLDINELTAMKVWLWVRFLKDCISNTLLSYGVSIWIYHLYKEYKAKDEKYETLFSHITFAVSVLCLALIAYSVVEVGFLRGSKFCADILSGINPMLYEIGSTHGWWPPLLLPDRLRSLFAEPSFFGIASVLIVFVLLYKNLTTKKVFFGAVLSAIVMMTVMTRSRTAIPLFIGQTGLLLLYVFTVDRKYIKGAAKIAAFVGLAFLAGIYLMAGFKPVPKTAAQAVKPAVTSVKPVVKNKANTTKPKVSPVKPVAKNTGPATNPKGTPVKPVAKNTGNITKPKGAPAKPVAKTTGQAAKPAATSVKQIAQNKANVKKPATAAVKPAVKAAGNVTKPAAKVATKSKETTFDLASTLHSFVIRIIPFTDKKSEGSDTERANSTIAYFLTGLQHPVYGVGKGLTNAYADGNFMKEDVWRNNRWSRYIRQKGVLQSPIPVLNHWSQEMAQFGIVGLLIFLLPAVYICYSLATVFRNGMNLEMACAAIAYIASNIAMLSSEAAFLTYYIFTGMLLIMLQRKTERQEIF